MKNLEVLSESLIFNRVIDPEGISSFTMPAGPPADPSWPAESFNETVLAWDLRVASGLQSGGPVQLPCSTAADLHPPPFSIGAEVVLLALRLPGPLDHEELLPIVGGTGGLLFLCAHGLSCSWTPRWMEPISPPAL
jgi:hypothetical protein